MDAPAGGADVLKVPRWAVLDQNMEQTLPLTLQWVDDRGTDGGRPWIVRSHRRLSALKRWYLGVP